MESEHNTELNFDQWYAMLLDELKKAGYRGKVTSGIALHHFSDNKLTPGQSAEFFIKVENYGIQRVNIVVEGCHFLDIVTEDDNWMAKDNRVYEKQFKKFNPGIYYGSKVFFVHKGFIRGFCQVVVAEKNNHGMQVTVDWNSWKWILPVKHRSVRFYKVIEIFEYEILGDVDGPYPGEAVPYSCPKIEAKQVQVCIYPYCNCKWLF